MPESMLHLLSPADDSAGSLTTHIPPPRSKWMIRLAIPMFIFLVAVALLAHTARDALSPPLNVWVVPVAPAPIDDGSLRNQSAASRVSTSDDWGPLLVQAPGWIEASPYAVSVAALAEGVIKEVIVLEGDRVQAGQLIARMVDEDARLAVRKAEAELASLRAEAARSEFDAQAAEARAAEQRDQLDRVRMLSATGGIAAGEIAQLEFRTLAAEKELGAARAAVKVQESAVIRQLIVLDELQLQLSRMEIRAPIDGVVLSRTIEPGTRITLGSRGRDESAATSEHSAGTVARLYDPASLQVRAEIPIADAAKVRIGDRAQITTEALPDKKLRGTVTRILHEANIQRNTVQVKIALHDPDPNLKPDMPARVRLHPAAATPEGTGSDAQGKLSATQPGLRRLVPATVLFDRQGDSAFAWRVNRTDGSVTVAESTRVQLGGETSDNLIEIRDGLQIGDRLIVDAPAGLRHGGRIRILGEK
ncbi:MAG: efflux RND transporter periplasmic adaptor subunit [Phycisphaerae bacterium]|nr:efflux RND transporter periplasmic adaptor subunit [Phycisphaerae bacterium]